MTISRSTPPEAPDPPPPRETGSGGDDPSVFTLVIVAVVLGLYFWWALRTCPAMLQAPVPAPDPAFSSPVCPPRGMTVDAEVVRVIDGDTIVVRTSIEYQVRLLDCWAPESRTKNAAEKSRGLKAKARMQQLAATGTAVRVHLPNNSSDLTDAITMGRILGRVWRIEDGAPADADLSSIMVAEGFATVRKVQP